MAQVDETDVDFTDADYIWKWTLAPEKVAAQTAELTWKEKALADATAGNDHMKDEGFYRIWRVNHTEMPSKKRGQDEDNEDEDVHS